MRRTLLPSLVVVLIVAAGVLAACAPATPQVPEPPKAQPTAPPAAPQATEPPKAQPTTPPTVAAAPAGGGAELLNARCTVCHNLDRVKSAKKTREQWTQTVSRMVGNGAKLNADEQAAVIEYLAKTYAP